MSASVLIEAVEVEGFGGGGVVAPAFGDVQVAGVFDGRDDGGADGGQVDGPRPVRLVEISLPKVTSRTDMMVRLDDQCSRTRRARSCAVASALVRLVTDTGPARPPRPRPSPATPAAPPISHPPTATVTTPATT